MADDKKRKEGLGGFSVREDHNGLRPIFCIGNELGGCPIGCTFCNMPKDGKPVLSEENIRSFDEQYANFKPILTKKYHPLVYNGGNIANQRECSREVLDHILSEFNKDENVAYVSINSREMFINNDLLDYLSKKELNFPIYFILGIESFSERTEEVLGKKSKGEFDRLVEKLKKYNQDGGRRILGVDVNLLFLPELYLDEGEQREGNDLKIKSGLLSDVRKVLSMTDQGVPIEINIHPFNKIETLPYKSVDVEGLLSIIPEIEELLSENNRRGESSVNLFVGVEGAGYETKEVVDGVERQEEEIRALNRRKLSIIR